MTYSDKTRHNGVNLYLVGTWQDLAAYYIGEDGSSWSYQRSLGWSKLQSFRNLRGKTVDGRPMSDLALDNRQLATFPENTRCIQFLDSGQQVCCNLPTRRLSIGGFQIIKISERGQAADELAVSVSDSSGTWFVHPNALKTAKIEDYATAK